MFKFLALGAHSQLSKIREDLNKKDVDFTMSKLSNLEMFISQNDVRVALEDENILDFDYVWLTTSWASRSIAYAVSLYLEQEGSNYSAVEEEKSKLVDMVVFGLDGIAIPDTYFSPTKLIKNRLSSIVAHCGYPFIMKPTKGSLGSGVKLIESEADFEAILPSLKNNKHYIFQRYIPNNFDYRILVAGTEIVSAVKRVRQDDDFRNNTHLGATEFFIPTTEIPKDIVKLAVDSTAVLKLTWSGVDIVTDSQTGKNYVLELNRRPGLTTGSTEVTAAFDHILNLATAQSVLNK